MGEIWRQLIENRKPRVITLIGGGGKTSLLYYLLTLLKDMGYTGIGTTTTKLSNKLLVGNSFVEVTSVKEAYQVVQEAKGMENHVTLVSREDKKIGKMVGIPSEWIDELAERCRDTIFVVEADGSAGKSLKGHLPYEPVIPLSSSLLIPVIGIDCVGKGLDAQNVHRPERISELTGYATNSIITTEMITELLFHPHGYLHNCPEEQVVVPFINKVESVLQRQQAKALGDQILACKYPRLDGVILGSLQQEEGLWLPV